MRSITSLCSAAFCTVRPGITASSIFNSGPTWSHPWNRACERREDPRECHSCFPEYGWLRRHPMPRASDDVRNQAPSSFSGLGAPHHRPLFRSWVTGWIRCSGFSSIHAALSANALNVRSSFLYSLISSALREAFAQDLMLCRLSAVILSVEHAVSLACTHPSLSSMSGHSSKKASFTAPPAAS